MSINTEPYFKLVKIDELSKIPKASQIQLVAKIEKIMDSNTLILNDGTGNYSLKNVQTDKYNVDHVIRVFGKWNGIDITVDKILDWDIPKEKLNLL